ncbi:MAG: PQQ-binding-like beta-propeller repeat protein [Thermoanaerobaculia bacterium]
MMTESRFPAAVAALVFCAAATFATPVTAGDVEISMFGDGPKRNMVNLTEKGLPSEWDVDSGMNVKWSQPVGSQSYAGPVVHGGKVFVGTNNEGRRNPELGADRGVVMAFDEKTGEFLWQMTHTKLPESKLHDWPLQGVCSTPAAEGDRLYYVSNRAQVVALDTEGFRDGENDGPYTDEANTGEFDGDVVWMYDLMAELDVFPHNLAAGSPLIVGDLVYASTGTGVDEAHINVPTPYAPSLVALDKKTGELVWDDATPDEKVLHGTWSNPSHAVIEGRSQVIFPAGDGWIYSFAPETGKILWKFDANPKESVWKLGGAGTRNNVISMGVIYDDKIYVGVGQDPEHGEAPGHFYAIDATLEGDVTEKGRLWSRDGKEFRRTISSAAIKDDIVYISDLTGFLYALDARTGEHYWTYDTFAAVWGSPFAADGKVYLADEDGDVVVIQEGKGEDGEPVILGEDFNMGAATYTTPVAHDGTLFILSRNRLFALAEGAAMKPQTKEAAGR